MQQLTLVIGNKNYSSWSLRPWLVLRYFDIPFEEVRIPLYRAESAAALSQWSPSGLVPVLKHGDITVWDSLAICEYLQELYPGDPLWPTDRDVRAVARSVAAQMHAGFTALRQAMPMNCRETFPGQGLTTGSTADIQHVSAVWRQCRETFGRDGNMLFGGFSIADAMYAPVALRFRTYGVKLDDVCESYVASLLSLPAMQEWVSAGRREEEVLEQFEPYRRQPS
jgi:glutathione S-transferase